MCISKPYFLIIVIFLIVIGCSPNIPKSNYPLQMKRSFHASFDNTWNAVLETVKKSEGTIITEDKSSGLIVYSFTDRKSKSQVYMNVYLKNYPTTNITEVYLIPWVKTNYSGYYLERGYYLEIDRDFFTLLEKILGGE